MLLVLCQSYCSRISGLRRNPNNNVTYVQDAREDEANFTKIFAVLAAYIIHSFLIVNCCAKLHEESISLATGRHRSEMTSSIYSMYDNALVY